MSDLDANLNGEWCAAAIRVVASPSTGSFFSSWREIDLPHEVHAGDVLGWVASSAGVVEATASASGVMQGYVAFDGQRVGTGEMVAWLSSGQES